MHIKHEDTLQQIGFNGEGYIKWEIPGWDREHLELKIKRNQGYYSTKDGNPEWTMDIEVPRWGRSRDKVKSDFEALKDVHEAYGDALNRIKDYEGRKDELEAEFQKGEAFRKAEAARKRAEEQAKIDADKPVGDKLAKMICDNMVKQARATQQDSKSIKFQERGNHREHEMRCIYTYTGLTLFNCGWERISRKDAVRKLADAWLNSVDTGDIKDQIPDARMAKFLMKA